MQVINLQEYISESDLQKGLSCLKKKNKYRNSNPTQQSRFENKSSIAKNALGDFLDKMNDGNLDQFYRELKDYTFGPYTAIAIKKGPTQFRPILLSGPRDRLVYDSLRERVSLALNSQLNKRRLLGLGLQKKQTISSILRNLHSKYIRDRYRYALILDFESFFTYIDREKLRNKMDKQINDPNLVELIMHIINLPIIHGEEVQEKTGLPVVNLGVPQGLSFSPLVSSFYALEIDDIYLDAKGIVGFRYIDDILILGKNKEQLKKIFKKIQSKSKKLKMKLHPLGGKSKLINLESDTINYLGADVNYESICISPVSIDKFIDVIKDEIFTPKNRSSQSISKLREVYYNYVVGWLRHYQGLVENKQDLFENLDSRISEYFLKHRPRARFYKENDWIIISKNHTILDKLKNSRTSKVSSTETH